MVTVSVANEKDLPGILECLKELNNNLPKNRDCKNIFDIRDLSSITTLVAKNENGLIIGTASFFVENKYIHDGGKVAHIEDVSVKKEYQKSGVGKYLINKIISIAKNKHDCYKILLTCSDKNKGFYEKLGFFEHEVSMRYNFE